MRSSVQRVSFLVVGRSPTDAVRRFELDVVAEAPANRRVRELHVLGGLNALEVVVSKRIAEVVAVCREQGASWSEIAAILHVSKQAAHERFGHRKPPTPAAPRSADNTAQ
ncbi:MAG: hypothetical protein ACRDTG_18785 [Pseudonocardiaceae bacterium]